MRPGLAVCPMRRVCLSTESWCVMVGMVRYDVRDVGLGLWMSGYACLVSLGWSDS